MLRRVTYNGQDIDEKIIYVLSIISHILIYIRKEIMICLDSRSNENIWNTLKYGSFVALCFVIMATGVATLMAQSEKIAAKDQESAEAITAALKALGGEKNIYDIKSLILTGTRTYSSNSSVDRIEIKILLPENILMIQQRPDRGMIMYTGVSKGEVRNSGWMGSERILTPSFTANEELNRFGLLLMGILLRSDPVAPITLASMAGASDKFIITKETGALGEMEFDPTQKYPSRIGYKDTVRNFTQQQNTNTNSNIGKIVIGPSAPETVDDVILFKDRTAIDGVMFPRTIVYERQGKPFRELKIENIQINPELTLADFEVP